uniref:Pectinesterase inhibitor domain-containing protein n=1 Tax=Leersia perrieri TaxID=77586 RepID=A0A0D9WU20_9ORYZ
MSRPLLAAAALLLAFAFAVAAASASPAASDFIRKSCRATQYPALCVQSLASYGSPAPHSPRDLARAALSVSVDRARSASAYVGHLRIGGGGGGAVRDCLENMADSVGHLRDAAAELGGNMGRAGSAGFRWHLSNVQTWCSAALTDENTCLDGLAVSRRGGGGGAGVDAATRSAIRGKVVEVAQVTSNALALVNRVAPNY